MLRCLAIDDEPLALELLEDNISQVPYLKLEGKCNNALEALKFLQDHSVDLIFLDIQMPGLTGLQFIQSLTQKPMIILITAYEKFALEGYNLDVVDYLVNPVPLDRFIKACNKAWELHNLRSRKAENSPSVEAVRRRVEPASDCWAGAGFCAGVTGAPARRKTATKVAVKHRRAIILPLLMRLSGGLTSH